MSKIIEENEFESLRLFDNTSQMHQCVEKRLKKIFENLFQGTEANVDDFYFSVTDEEDLNAFFLNKKNTIEKKRILYYDNTIEKTKDFVRLKKIG